MTSDSCNSLLRSHPKYLLITFLTAYILHAYTRPLALQFRQLLPRPAGRDRFPRQFHAVVDGVCLATEVDAHTGVEDQRIEVGGITTGQHGVDQAGGLGG